MLNLETQAARLPVACASRNASGMPPRPEHAHTAPPCAAAAVALPRPRNLALELRLASFSFPDEGIVPKLHESPPSRHSSPAPASRRRRPISFSGESRNPPPVSLAPRRRPEACGAPRRGKAKGLRPGASVARWLRLGTTTVDVNDEEEHGMPLVSQLSCCSPLLRRSCSTGAGEEEKGTRKKEKCKGFNEKSGALTCGPRP